jgi:hypothetical protein
MQELINQTFLLVIVLFYPVWRIYKRAGVNQNYCFTLLIPFVGIFVCAGILAFSTWHIKSLEDKQ